MDKHITFCNDIKANKNILNGQMAKVAQQAEILWMFCGLSGCDGPCCAMLDDSCYCVRVQRQLSPTHLQETTRKGKTLMTVDKGPC